jgi:hypothetical protein
MLKLNRLIRLGYSRPESGPSHLPHSRRMQAYASLEQKGETEKGGKQRGGGSNDAYASTDHTPAVYDRGGQQ